jgi:hypothetical protein
MPKEAVQCVLTPEQDSKLRRQLQQGKLRLESFINEGDWKSVEVRVHVQNYQAINVQTYLAHTSKIT